MTEPEHPWLSNFRSAVMSAQSCGCDLGANWVCAHHRDHQLLAENPCDWYIGNADGATDCEYARGHEGPHSFVKGTA